jgi:general secretion pathway protein L
MNLQTTIDFDLKGFFHWWGQELSFLVPKRIRQILSDRPANLVFTPEDIGFNACLYPEGQINQPLFDCHLDSSDAVAYQNLNAQHVEIDKAECILRLTAAQAIAKVIYLPEAALENLQQVVGFELDRYTPFTADLAYYTVVTLGKTGQGQVRLLLVLCPQPVLDELLASLNSLGVRPIRVEYQYVNQNYPQLIGQYNLLPDRYRPETGRLAQSVHWLLSGLIFGLLLAAMVYPVWQEMQAVTVLKSQIKALEKDTHYVDEQQLEIDALSNQTQNLINIKNQSPELIAVLNELSHLLKDDTWLTNLQYSDKHMQIQGQSPMASALISTLEASRYFSKVSFVSPLTQDKTTGLERFQISMDVGAKLAEAAQPTVAPAARAGDSRQTAPMNENIHE